MAPSPTVDDLLVLSERLLATRRPKQAIRRLTALLDREGALSDAQRTRTLRLRIRALMDLGLDRRAWRDVRALGSTAEARALEATLWERNAPPAKAREAVRAMARAHPTEAALWKRVQALTPPDFNGVGHHAELALGLAQAPDASDAQLLRTADLLARCGARSEATAVLDRIPGTDPGLRQQVLRIRARICMATRDRQGLADLADDLAVGDLDDLLTVYRVHLAAGRIHDALALLQTGEPTPMDPRWLRATVLLLCQTGQLTAAGDLLQRHGTPGDDAHIVWWGAQGDHAAIRAADPSAGSRDWPTRLIHEAEAWLDRPNRRERAFDRLHAALRLSLETNPAIALNELRYRGDRLHCDVVRTGLAPLLPAELDTLSSKQQHAWLRTHATRLLDRLGGGRDELVVYRDDADELQVFHAPIDQRLDLASFRGGLLDLGFGRTLQAYDDWRDRFGDPPLWYTYRGEIRLWSGDVDGARQDLETALSRDPDTRWAYVGLGLVHVAQGRPEAALEVLAEGTNRLGELTSGWPVAAEARLRLGRLAEGRSELERAVAHRPYRLSIRIVEALYQLAEGHDATDLVRSISATYPRIWAAAAGEGVRARLASMLTMMGANRSSSLIVWQHPTDGWCLTQARTLV